MIRMACVHPHPWLDRRLDVRADVLVCRNPCHDVHILGLGFLGAGVIALIAVPVVQGVEDDGVTVAQGHRGFVGIAGKRRAFDACAGDGNGIRDVRIGDQVDVIGIRVEDHLPHRRRRSIEREIEDGRGAGSS